MDLDRWTDLCARIGCESAEDRFTQLVSAYSEPHRHYHGTGHLLECLALFDRCVTSAERADEVEFALWIHDAVHRPTRRDNEERSADLAEGWLHDSNASAEVIGRVRGLILATAHVREPETEDQALLQDIDLAVLAAPPRRYAEYERQVRREVRWVPGFLFRRRRAALLRGFLDRDTIYRTAWFRERHEQRARGNLEASLRALGS